MGCPIPAINGLYAITPDSADTQDLLRRCALALSGGARVLQYRNKSAGVALRLVQARALRDLTREFAAVFIVNDDAYLAAQVDADGVHLGAADGELADARAILGAGKLLGASCYNRASLAFSAAKAGADYVAFGAFFPSSVKPEAVKAEVTLLQAAKRELNVPIVAIGGITVRNGAALIEAGADALAVISAVFDADNIEAAAGDLTGLFRQNMT
jgi:thiamine-phosphate pyrophosphorylase